MYDLKRAALTRMGALNEELRMIERLYIDNFKTFQNFEWKPGNVALIMGRNGTGKSTLFEVLHLLQSLICGERFVTELFPETSRVRWDKRNSQQLEIDVRNEEGQFRYRLTIEHAVDRGEARITRETLHLEDTPLFSFEMGKIQLYNDGGKPGPDLSGNWKKSGLGLIVPGPSNKRLTWFKQWLGRLLVLRPNPFAMGGRAPSEDSLLLPDVSNFAAWFRYVYQERGRDVYRAMEALGKVLDGFQDMSIRVDEQRTGWLRANFVDSTGRGYQLQFDELSDGQRVLLLLYITLYTQTDRQRTITFDESDNFVSLDEIQPFLMDLLDKALDGSGPQIFIASHHPEYLNQLAPSHGHVLFRERGGHTRVRPFESNEALPAAEIVARGGLTRVP
jgi:predicted ATPase